MSLRIIAMDDDPLCLRALTRSILEAAPDCELLAFDTPEAALECAERGDIDVAFLDIETQSITGIELTKRLIALHQTINIVFCTAYLRYTYDALELFASGYIPKPVTADAVRKQLTNLRYPIADRGARLTVRCFGRFQVLSGGEPIRFSRSKVQELLAYIIYRQGAAIKIDEVIDVLFDGKPKSTESRNHFRVLLHYLLSELREAGADGAVIREGDSLCLMTGMLACDYFDFFKGDARAIASFKGEFMTQYAWAEPMVAVLERKRHK